MVTASYLMEDPREASRLRLKVNSEDWIERYLERWLPRNGRVLEVGCGPGHLAIALGRRRPDLDVTGIDLNAARFADSLQALPDNLRLIAGQAHTLPIESNSYDLVYSRFLLEYLPDKSGAVRELVRACTPGGRVFLQDLDGQLLWNFPEDTALQSGVQQVLRGLAKSGFDPFVGRTLFSLLKAQCLQDIVVAGETYHMIAGSIDDFNRSLWETKLDIVLPAAAAILGTEAEATALKQRFLEYLERDDTLTYSVVFTVVGQKPFNESSTREVA